LTDLATGMVYKGNIWLTYLATGMVDSG
jgi:hypothetical protein